MYEFTLPDAYAQVWESKARYLFWLLVMLVVLGSTALLTWFFGGPLLVSVLAALMITTLVGFFSHQYWMLYNDKHYAKQNVSDTRFLSWLMRALLAMSLGVGLMCLFAPGGPGFGVVITAMKHLIPHAHLAFHIFAFAGLFFAAIIVAAVMAMAVFRFIRWLAPKGGAIEEDLATQSYEKRRYPATRAFAWGCLLSVTMASVFALLGPGGAVPALVMAISTLIPQLPVYAGVFIALACLPFAMGFLNKIWQKDDPLIHLADDDLGESCVMGANWDKRGPAADYVSLSNRSAGKRSDGNDHEFGHERFEDPGPTEDPTRSP